MHILYHNLNRALAHHERDGDIYVVSHSHSHVRCVSKCWTYVPVSRDRSNSCDLFFSTMTVVCEQFVLDGSQVCLGSSEYVRPKPSERSQCFYWTNSEHFCPVSVLTLSVNDRPRNHDLTVKSCSIKLPRYNATDFMYCGLVLLYVSIIHTFCETHTLKLLGPNQMVIACYCILAGPRKMTNCEQKRKTSPIVCVSLLHVLLCI